VKDNSQLKFKITDTIWRESLKVCLLAPDGRGKTQTLSANNISQEFHTPLDFIEWFLACSCMNSWTIQQRRHKKLKKVEVTWLALANFPWATQVQRCKRRKTNLHQGMAPLPHQKVLWTSSPLYVVLHPLQFHIKNKNEVSSIEEPVHYTVCNAIP